MIQLFFVGDGDRDLIAIPEIVKGLTKCDFAEESHAWARLHGSGRGYAKKLKFAIRAAISVGSDGVVAVVDQDRAPRGLRLQELSSARDEDRQNQIRLPTAIGEARPHGEAWLLDDAAAVRTALGLRATESIPSVTKTKSPKGELEVLIANSNRAGDRTRIVLGDIAENVERSRCAHADETGFAEFANEIDQEIKPIFSS